MKSNWRILAEKKFLSLSNFIYEHAFKVIAVLLILVFTIGINLPKITFDTSTEGFLYKDDPLILDYNAFRDQFGRDEKIIIAIKTKDVFDPSFLTKLFAIHKEIEDTSPYIKEVNSLKNARKTTGTDDALLIEDLFDDTMLSSKKLKEIKAYAMQNRIYENLYISEDASFTTIIISTNTYTSLQNNKDISDEEDEFEEDKFDENVKDLPFITPEETAKSIKSITKIIEKYKSKDFIVNIAGSPIVTNELQHSLMKDMSSFIFYVIGIISILLFFMFKRISGIFLPLLIVILTLITTIGLMAFFKSPITSMTQILPSLLLAVGVGASVHLLAMFFKEFNQNGNKKDAIGHALEHSGLAVLMTSLTTAASLSSFSFSDIAPVAALGIFSAIGVMISMVLTLLLLPAFLAILPLKQKEIKDKKRDTLDIILDFIINSSIIYPKTIVTIFGLIIAVSLFLSTMMKFSHNPLHWFQKGHEVRTSTEIIDHELKGSITIEVVLDTKKENGVYDVDFLNSIELASDEIRTFKNENYFIGKVVSINDVLKEINVALNANNKAFDTIPQDPNLVAQEFLLFENSGSDDLEDVVDSRFSKTRISIKAPWVDAVEYVELIGKIETTLNHYIGEKATISVTGILPILAATITKSIESSIESYIIAFGVIALLMIVLIGSMKLGLYSMIPNLMPIVFALGLMVVFDLPLDMFTILIGAIAIGMIVDDTIHFMHNFRRYHALHTNVDEAIKLTMHSTGRAIFITSIVLGSGFFVFMFASMTNLFNFGLITGVTVLVALVANLALTPALMKLVIKE